MAFLGEQFQIAFTLLYEHASSQNRVLHHLLSLSVVSSRDSTEDRFDNGNQSFPYACAVAAQQ